MKKWKNWLLPIFTCLVALCAALLPQRLSELRDRALLGAVHTEKQENTHVQQWLMAHCAEYGFILRYPTGKSEITGIGYEPWHYRYVGLYAAREIAEQGLCLEEYLDSTGTIQTVTQTGIGAGSR